MPPTTSTTLDIEAVDVTATAWDDLMREVLADDPDAVAPIFFPERGIQAVTSPPPGGCSSSSGSPWVSCVSCVFV
jgi:hypothetical protein